MILEKNLKNEQNDPDKKKWCREHNQNYREFIISDFFFLI